MQVRRAIWLVNWLGVGGGGVGGGGVGGDGGGCGGGSAGGWGEGWPNYVCCDSWAEGYRKYSIKCSSLKTMDLDISNVNNRGYYQRTITGSTGYFLLPQIGRSNAMAS